MGSSFEFIIVEEPEAGYALIETAIEEVKRIETLLTEFSSTSQISQINQAAGMDSVSVDEEVYAIIKRCNEISNLTQGAFDITAVALRKLYNFKGQHFVWPDEDQIKNALNSVGHHLIDLSKSNAVFLKKSGMHIAFGAIGKGYAADCVKKILKERGVENAVINASGDLTAWGNRLDGSRWKIGIADPDKPSNILAWLPIQNSSVATSGDYEQFVERNGIRYSHTIDPKTGHPVKGIKSVTIFGPSAELCDALATAVTIMGVTVGLYFLDQLPNIQGIIINDRNKIFTSRYLNWNNGEHHE
ncbi:MAG TPA: FAD:protein FMN transferase [Chryseolinea sp.]|nr:FAD:protein FMN transferase [Chryseolinea sp.]HPM29360.1 FAD:protein FMN transferase [Chryseolinea sp.]